MSNFINPSAIIFINSDINPISLLTIQKQLNIDSTIDISQFLYNTTNIANYSGMIHGQGMRILVLVPLNDLSIDRTPADIVLSYRNGLVYVESNKFGPPGKSLTIDRVYLQELLH